MDDNEERVYELETRYDERTGVRVEVAPSRLTPSEDVKGLIDELDARVSACNDEAQRGVVSNRTFDQLRTSRQAILDAFSSRDARIRELEARVLTPEELGELRAVLFLNDFDELESPKSEIWRSIRSKLTTQEGK